MTHFCEGLTTEILIEILLKKVRHPKCDPLLGVGQGWGLWVLGAGVIGMVRVVGVVGLAGWGSVVVRCVKGFTSFMGFWSD